MLGAESQNIFDFHDNDGRNEEEEEEEDEGSDDASADGVVAQQFVLPHGSIQWAGELAPSQRDALAGGARAVLGHAPDGMPTSAGEPTESSRVAAGPRVRRQDNPETWTLQARGPVERAPIVAAAASSSALDEQKLMEEDKKRMREAEARLLERWANLHNVDVSTVTAVVPDAAASETGEDAKLNPNHTDSTYPLHNGSRTDRIMNVPLEEPSALEKDLWAADTQIFDPNASVGTGTLPGQSGHDEIELTLPSRQAVGSTGKHVATGSSQSCNETGVDADEKPVGATNPMAEHQPGRSGSRGAFGQAQMHGKRDEHCTRSEPMERLHQACEEQLSSEAPDPSQKEENRAKLKKKKSPLVAKQFSLGEGSETSTQKSKSPAKGANAGSAGAIAPNLSLLPAGAIIKKKKRPKR